MKKILVISMVCIGLLGTPVYAQENTDTEVSERTQCIQEANERRTQQLTDINELFNSRVASRLEELQDELSTINEQYTDLDPSDDNYRELRKEQRQAIRDANNEYRAFHRQERKLKRAAEREVRTIARDALRECRSL